MAKSIPRVLLMAIGWALLAQPAAADPSAAQVNLSANTQKALAISTQRLTSAKRASEVDAFAKVLDPAPLIQADSDLRTAEAAATASKAEANRSVALNKSGGSVAAKDMEAAVSQARSDALKVQLLHQQIDSQWGPGISKLGVAKRERLVAGLANGSIALVHVDTHNNEGQDGARSVRVDIGADSISGPVLGPARIAEPRLQSSGLIVEISGHDAILLSVGLTNSAHIAQTTPEVGVVVPRGAVIRFQGSDWAYVRTGPTTFERRLLEAPIPETDGLFVAKGLAAGDEVVVQNAIGVFAAEQSQPMKAN